MSLRRGLAVGSVVVGLAVVAVCLALASVTTTLRHINEETTRNLEALRLAEETKIDLLMLSGMAAPSARVDEVEADAMAKLRESHAYATPGREQAALAHAQAEVSRYLERLRAGGSDARLGGAYEAVDALIAINSEQGAQALARAAAWDRRASGLGYAVAALLVAILAAFLWWVRERGIRPIFGVGDAMTRFGRGERDARAATRGPAEIREIAVRFNEMADALASQRQAQMTFLAGVAHDLRNPVTVLKMSVEIVRRSESLPPEALRDVAERIRRQLTRLERMVTDLLDVTKIEAGQLEVKIEPHDAVRVVRQAVDLFEGNTANHHLVVRLPDAPVELACDALRIEQVVTNLVSNAIKYSPPGTDVEVALDRKSGGDVEVRVSDHGVGIAPEDQKRLFEPFRRVGLSKESVAGVGLGLFVVRRIVEAHHGRIQIDSEPARGTTFRVLLPAAPA